MIPFIIDRWTFYPDPPGQPFRVDSAHTDLAAKFNQIMAYTPRFQLIRQNINRITLCDTITVDLKPRIPLAEAVAVH